MEKSRIVVFTGDLSHSVRRGILTINQSNADISWLIVIHSPKKTLKQLLKNQWRNLSRNGLRWIPYQLLEIYQRIFPVRLAPFEVDSPGYRYSLEAFKENKNITILSVDNIHAKKTLDVVHNFLPDLGLSLAAPILKSKLFSIPKLGTLNLHKGKLPDYRGMPPAFWELWNNEGSIGCTVHMVNEQLDAGGVVKETLISTQTYSTLKGLQLNLDEVGISLMHSAVGEVLTEDFEALEPSGDGKLYRKPTLVQMALLDQKMRAKSVTSGYLLKSWVKDCFFSARINLCQLFPHSFKKSKVTVLLYHRVSDNARDNVTVGIEQFDRQMALLRRHYQVLSIQDLVDTKDFVSSSKPMVCVTFDDGYLDNYENAVPILLKHGIPASFFVSTGIVSTDGIFQHDLKRKQKKLPMMTWAQLRAMQNEGFTIGSHTVNHIDCASEDEEIVRSELTQSLFDIQRELGIKEVIFAYPYGGRQHMTPERLQLVKEAGYSACLSAYGGVNVNQVDCYNIVRGGIHFEFSDWAFRNRCEGF